MVIAFTKSRLPFGWLGNMSPFPLTHGGKVWPTAEHLFQALRFEDEALREALRAVRNPFSAKVLAKANADRMTVQPCGARDLENMAVVLRLKLEQHPDLADALRATGQEEIIEDCTHRPHGNALFWGAVLRDGTWVGENRLGRLWMRLRDELQEEDRLSRGPVAQAVSGV
jgi:ribA/ribD-fused uncharacterized protein